MHVQFEANSPQMDDACFQGHLSRHILTKSIVHATGNVSRAGVLNPMRILAYLSEEG
jgi:hypothetical protein